MGINLKGSRTFALTLELEPVVGHSCSAPYEGPYPGGRLVGAQNRANRRSMPNNDCELVDLILVGCVPKRLVPHTDCMRESPKRGRERYAYFRTEASSS